MIPRTNKESQLKQKAKVIWFTGLSGAGKTTLGELLEKKLTDEGRFCIRLDGDTMRKGLSWDLSFSISDRIENVSRTAHIAKLLVDNGVIVIACLITPLHSMRRLAQDIIGYNDFILVYVNTPLEVCIARDTKGLYKKAQEGKIEDMTGMGSDFEKPLLPRIDVDTKQTPEECCDYIYSKTK